VWGNRVTAPGLKPPTADLRPSSSRPSSSSLYSRPYNPRPPPKTVLASRKLLPTWGHREEILSKLDENEVIIVQGATGSGKSTQVAQYLLDRGDPKIKVLCTQPRRLGKHV
jgi:HrpA-like RNA helicase